MKNWYLLLVISLCVFSCKSVEINSSIKEKDYFSLLDKEVVVHNWGMNNKDKAVIFESIYTKNINDHLFLKKLNNYCNTPDRCYWIGTYLDSEYYTNISNYELSVSLLKKALSIEKSEPNRVRILFVLGKKLYYKGQKKDSLIYLKEAYLLAKEYPGTTPTWDSDEEYNDIMNYIKANM